MDRETVMTDAQPVLLKMALISYGGVAALKKSRGGETERVGPKGENDPLYLTWSKALESAPTPEKAMIVLDEARAELAAWIRRPFRRDHTESLADLCARIVSDGWGISANECAVAMRCTPTLVRRARLDAGRHPESGYHLPAEQPDRMAWARELDAAGLSLRQIELVTGLPRSTVHGRLRK